MEHINPLDGDMFFIIGFLIMWTSLYSFQSGGEGSFIFIRPNMEVSLFVTFQLIL